MNFDGIVVGQGNGHLPQNTPMLTQGNVQGNQNLSRGDFLTTPEKHLGNHTAPPPTAATTNRFNMQQLLTECEGILNTTKRNSGPVDIRRVAELTHLCTSVPSVQGQFENQAVFNQKKTAISQMNEREQEDYVRRIVQGSSIRKHHKTEPLVIFVNKQNQVMSFDFMSDQEVRQRWAPDEHGSVAQRFAELKLLTQTDAGMEQLREICQSSVGRIRKQTCRPDYYFCLEDEPVQYQLHPTTGQVCNVRVMDDGEETFLLTPHELLAVTETLQVEDVTQVISEQLEILCELVKAEILQSGHSKSKYVKEDPLFSNSPFLTPENDEEEGSSEDDESDEPTDDEDWEEEESEMEFDDSEDDEGIFSDGDFDDDDDRELDESDIEDDSNSNGGQTSDEGMSSSVRQEITTNALVIENFVNSKK